LPLSAAETLVTVAVVGAVAVVDAAEVPVRASALGDVLVPVPEALVLSETPAPVPVPVPAVTFDTGLADAVPWHEPIAKAHKALPADIATKRIRRWWAVTRPTVPCQPPVREVRAPGFCAPSTPAVSALPGEGVDGELSA
jgi:hypothetical protein